MTTKHLVKIDVTGKQDYIFSSNRLKEIIGASEIVRFVTEDLGWIILSKKTLPQDIQFSPQWYDGMLGNVLFIGGGNSTYVFEDRESAVYFTQQVSRICVKHFEGLRVLIESAEWTSENRLAGVIEQLDQQLNYKKLQGFNMLQRTGFGLVEVCPNTGKAAGYNPFESAELTKDKSSSITSKTYSKETMSKWVFFQMTRKGSEENEVKWYGLLEKMANALRIDLGLISDEPLDLSHFQKRYSGFGGISSRYEGNLNDWHMAKMKFNSMPSLIGYDFSYELDDIGDWNFFKPSQAKEKEKPVINGSKYLGISCLDGNGFGEMFRKFSGYYKTHLDDQTYIENFRSLSGIIDSLFYEALEKVTETVCIHQEKCYTSESFKKGLMLRPIIVAGDDLTLISHGKIALDVSQLLIKEMLTALDRQKETLEKILPNSDEEEDNDDKTKHAKLTVGVSAGVAMVPRKYPFARAVQLAEDLQKEVKRQTANTSKDSTEIKHNNPNARIEIGKSGMGWALERGVIKSETQNSERRNCFIESNPDNSNHNEMFKSIEYSTIMSFAKKVQSGKLSKGKLADFFRVSDISEEAGKLFCYKYGIELDEYYEASTLKDNTIIKDCIELMLFVETLERGDNL